MRGIQPLNEADGMSNRCTGQEALSGRARGRGGDNGKRSKTVAAGGNWLKLSHQVSDFEATNNDATTFPTASARGARGDFIPLMRLGIIFTVAGICLVAAIIALFWLKDRLESPRLARIAYSEPVMRLAVVGAALTVIGLLLMVSSQW